MASVTEQDIKNVRRALSDVVIGLSKKLAQITGDAAVQQIRERTQSGRETTGKFFKGYSPNTPKKGRVDLFESGDMQGSLRYDKSGKFIDVSPSQRAKAEAHHFGRGPAYRKSSTPRPWVGLSRAGATKVGKEVGDETTKVIRRNAGSAYEVSGQGYVGADSDILVVQNP